MLVYKYSLRIAFFGLVLLCTAIEGSQENNGNLMKLLSRSKRSVQYNGNLSYLVSIIKNVLQNLDPNIQCSLLSQLIPLLQTLQATVCNGDIRIPDMPQPLPVENIDIFDHEDVVVDPSGYIPSYPDYQPDQPPQQPYIIRPGIIFIPGRGNVAYKLYIMGELNGEGDLNRMSITPGSLQLQGVLSIPSLNFQSQPFSLAGVLSGSDLQVNMAKLAMVIMRIVSVQLTPLVKYNRSWQVPSIQGNLNGFMQPDINSLIQPNDNVLQPDMNTLPSHSMLSHLMQPSFVPSMFSRNLPRMQGGIQGLRSVTQRRYSKAHVIHMQGGQDGGGSLFGNSGSSTKSRWIDPPIYDEDGEVSFPWDTRSLRRSGNLNGGLSTFGKSYGKQRWMEPPIYDEDGEVSFPWSRRALSRQTGVLSAAPA